VCFLLCALFAQAQSPQFISPTNGATGLPSSFTVQIGAHPTAAYMILQVFRVGGGIVSQDQQFGSGPYNFPISGLAGSTQYQIKAIALNSGGATLGFDYYYCYH
jgi:hypothetical protein